MARKKNTTAELPEVSVSDDGEVRHLHLGTPWIQGSMRIDDPFHLELEYIQRMMAWLLFMEPDAVRKGQLSGPEARAQLQPLMPDQSCNGYWHGRPGLELVDSPALVPA